MCGIAAAVAREGITVPIGFEGLKRLEYRGRKSAGVVVLGFGSATHAHSVGPVAELEVTAGFGAPVSIAPLIALEGEFKRKETSYIQTEPCADSKVERCPPAPLEDELPTVAVAPNGVFLHNLKSNVEEIQTGDRALYMFADAVALRLSVICLDRRAKGRA